MMDKAWSLNRAVEADTRGLNRAYLLGVGTGAAGATFLMACGLLLALAWGA